MIFSNHYKWYCLGFFKKQYQINPLELARIRKNFQKFDWRNSHQKYLLSIIKVLAENGKSTISEIVNCDGLAQDKKRKLSRHKIYSRIIEGSKDGKVKGLVPNQILHVAEKVMTSKPSKKYELSYHGVFLAIHIFSREKYSLTDFMDKITRPKYDEFQEIFVKENFLFLDKLAFNYKHFLPLIFGKWEFIKNEFPEGIDYLIKFAEEGYYEQDQIDSDDPFMNPTIIEDVYPNGPSFHFFPNDFDWTSGNYFQEEITMWFYTLLLRRNDYYEFQIGIKKDDDVFDWVNTHTEKVIARQKEILSNSKNIQSWLKNEKPSKMEYLLQFSRENLDSKFWESKKLSKLRREIFELDEKLQKNNVVEGHMGRVLDMNLQNKLQKEIHPKLLKLRWQLIRKLVKILKEEWHFSKNTILEYLPELHFILESQYSLRLFTINLGDESIPIRQIPPEELRLMIRRNNWDFL